MKGRGTSGDSREVTVNRHGARKVTSDLIIRNPVNRLATKILQAGDWHKRMGYLSCCCTED